VLESSINQLTIPEYIVPVEVSVSPEESGKLPEKLDRKPQSIKKGASIVVATA